MGDPLSDFCDSTFDLLTHAKDMALDALKPLAALLGFEDQTITLTAMAVSRIIEDEDIPHNTSFINAILKSVIGDSSIPIAIQTSIVSGPKSTINRYVKYAQEYYIYGLPTMGFKSPPVHIDKFDTIAGNVLTNKSYTLSGTLAASTIVTPTAYDWALAYLQDNNGYTNFIDVGGTRYVYTGAEVGGSPAVFRAILVNYPTPTAPDYTYITLPDRTSSPYQTYYKWDNTVVDVSGNEFRFVYLFPFNYAGDDDAHTEMLESSTGDTDNDALTNDLTRALPITILKKNWIYSAEAEDPADTPEWYATTKDLAKTINFDLDQMVESLQENDDMADVSDAFLVCGVTPYSNLPQTLLYLFTYFSVLYDTMAVASYSLYTSGSPADVSTHVVKFVEETYNVSLLFNYIRKEYITGSIGETNTIQRDFDIREDLTVTIGYTTGSDTSEPITKTVNDSRLIFKRQINATTYEQYTIHGLQLLTIIYGADGAKKGNVASLVSEDADASEKECFLIPLSFMFLGLYGIENVEKILYESFNLVFFASQQQHLDWHSTAEFITFATFIIRAIGLILAIPSGMTTYWWAEAIGNLLVQHVLAELFHRILLHNDFTDAQTAALMVAYMYATSSTGGTGFFSTKSGMADKILKAISVMNDTYTVVTDGRIGKLAEELEEQQELYETYSAYLEDILDGTKKNTDIDPLNIMTSRPIRHESPRDFYARTRARNTTEVAVRYPALYVDSMLDLGNIKINTGA